MIRQEAKGISRVIAEMAFVETSSETREKMYKFCGVLEAAGRIDAMIDLASTEERVIVTPDVFDRDVYHHKTPAGTNHLKTGERRPHHPADYITKLTAVAPDSAANRPVFDAFLLRIMSVNGNLIRFLQKLFGLCLSGDVSEHIFPIFHGKGANGKSTLLELILHILGDYAATVNFATISLRKHGDSTYNDLAALKGKRFVVVDEGAAGVKLNEELVKKITGSKMITARFLFREFFTYLRAFKIVLVSNHKPTIAGTDHAIWRRVHLIPFDVVISDEEQDKKLGEKLAAEGPAILAWLVEGYLAWQRDGLGVPEEVKRATEEYKEEEDPLAEFLADRCVVDKKLVVSTQDLYAAYTDWAGKTKETPLKKNDFGAKLNERGFDAHRMGKKRYRVGLNLRGDEVTK
jgi:putative DNA primase/helicase